MLMNVKNHTIYSDKIRLSVLNLSRIDLADEEDQQYHLDYWASLFKATTWEELKMLAKQDEFINEASATVYQLSQEEMIRLQCEAREDYCRRQRSVQRMMENQKETIENQNAIIQELTDNNIILKDEISSLQQQLSDALTLVNSIKKSDMFFMKMKISLRDWLRKK